MHTDTTKDDALKGNEDFMTFLHKDAREAKVPATCDKAELAKFWMDWATNFMQEFAKSTGKGLTIENSEKFFRQAAESYKG